MPVPAIVPPAHLSAEWAWQALSPVRPFLLDGRGKLSAGITALDARQMFAQLERMMSNINAQITGGLLDGDAAWKAAAADTLTALAGLAAVASPIQQKYSQLTGDLISQSAAAGTVLSIDEASAQVTIDAADTAALIAAVDAALGW